MSVNGDAASSAEKVSDWLKASDAGSVAGRSDYGGAYSEAGDDLGGVKEFVERAIAVVPEEPIGFEDQVSVEGALQEVAFSEQRMIVATCRSKYVRGRAHMDRVAFDPPVVRQRAMLISGYMTLASLDDEGFYAKLSQGRVVARLGAATGMGKTHKLPGLIAKRCGLRVCLVTVDAVIASLALKSVVSGYGVPTSNRRWRREKSAFAAALSYHDFVGIVRSNGRKRFFSDFDVFLLDEPHKPLAEIYATKHMLTAYVGADTSVLLMSATVSTDESNDVRAKTVGSFLVEPVSGGMRALVKSGDLWSKYVADCTLVLVAGNRQVNSIREYYADEGYLVRTLDTGSSEADVVDTNKWLTGDSMVPRIVVAEEMYGTAYNLKVKYVVTSATRLVYDVDASGALIEQEIPLREAEVTQHKGRTGRGLVSGSGGVVASAVRDVGTSDLLKCEYLKAYLMLVAASIQPNAALFDRVSSLIPNGVTREVACMILSIELPPALVLRYMGSDGRIARRFASAMELYCQPDFNLQPSRDYDPIGFKDWISEKVGRYYEGHDTVSNVEVQVPFPSPDSLKVVMHTLYAVAYNWIVVDRWRPEGYDDATSDEEDLGLREVTRKKRVVPLRKIENLPKLQLPEPPPKDSWRYNAKQSDMVGRSRRKAMSWVGEPDADKALESLKERAERRGSFGSVTADTRREVQDDGVVLVSVSQNRGPVDVSSPGGTVLVRIGESLYEDLVNGVVLTPGKLMSLMKCLVKIVEGFAKSTLFDNFSNVWLSVLFTAADRDSVNHVMREGYSSTLTKLIEFLHDRFRAEVFAVCSTSYLYQRDFKSFLRGASGGISVSRLNRYIRKGKLPIAQSDKFIQRVMALEDAHVAALQALEHCGLFMPSVVTRMQEPMPVQSRKNMPVVGDELIGKVGGDSSWKERARSGG